jgi:hypothetical protein
MISQRCVPRFALRMLYPFRPAARLTESPPLGGTPHRQIAPTPGGRSHRLLAADRTDSWRQIAPTPGGRSHRLLAADRTDFRRQIAPQGSGYPDWSAGSGPAVIWYWILAGNQRWGHSESCTRQSHNDQVATGSQPCPGRPQLQTDGLASTCIPTRIPECCQEKRRGLALRRESENAGRAGQLSQRGGDLGTDTGAQFSASDRYQGKRCFSLAIRRRILPGDASRSWRRRILPGDASRSCRESAPGTPAAGDRGWAGGCCQAAAETTGVQILWARMLWPGRMAIKSPCPLF